MVREIFIQAAYLLASVLFIFGLRSLTKADEARRGMNFAALGMLVAIVGTLVHQDIVRYDWIIAGLVLGTVIGYPLGMFVPMTAMPQRIAISHLFGALAASLVGIAEYWNLSHAGGVPRGTMAALGFEVLFGSLTVTGSFMAFGKLQEILPGRPVTYPGQNAVNITLFFTTVGCFGYLVLHHQPHLVHQPRRLQQQPLQDRRGDVVGQVGHHFPARLVAEQFGQVGMQEILDNHDQSGGWL